MELTREENASSLQTSLPSYIHIEKASSSEQIKERQIEHDFITGFLEEREAERKNGLGLVDEQSFLVAESEAVLSIDSPQNEEKEG